MPENNLFKLLLQIGLMLVQVQVQLLEWLLGLSPVFGLNQLLLPLLGLMVGQSLGLALVQMQIQAMKFILGLSVLILGLVLLLMLWKKPFSLRSLSTKQLYCLLPEDWRSDLETRLQRLYKAKKSKWFIRFKTIQHLSELLWAAVQIKWQSLWLPKNKEVEQ